jgi:hypothetical protein
MSMRRVRGEQWWAEFAVSCMRGQLEGELHE